MLQHIFHSIWTKSARRSILEAIKIFIPIRSADRCEMVWSPGQNFADRQYVCNEGANSTSCSCCSSSARTGQWTLVAWSWGCPKTQSFLVDLIQKSCTCPLHRSLIFSAWFDVECTAGGYRAIPMLLSKLKIIYQTDPPQK